MSFSEAITSVFSQYLGFNGRARRSEFWYFVLMNSIIITVLGSLAKHSILFGILDSLYSLAVLLPGLAVAVRRLHDIGKAWTWLFIALVPIAGEIILIIFCCRDSQPGANQYGPNPKGM